MKIQADDTINVMLLGGGKRVSLAQRFFSAGKLIGKKIRMFSYELDEKQPISIAAQIIIGKRWSDPAVSEHILEVVELHGINLLVSNVDPAVKIHAAIREKTPAARFVCDRHTADLCYSKILFQKKCEDLGLPIIPRWDGVTFPVIAKPDFGSASIGICTIGDVQELRKHELSGAKGYLLQRFICGEEFTVDAYVNQSNETCGISPRSRIETIGGESTVSKTVKDDKLIGLSEKVINLLALKGPLTLQYIRDRYSGQDYLMEVNTRFGGGVICSIEAGYDFPSMLIKELLGLPIPKVTKGKLLMMKRYFMESFYATDH